MISTLIFKPMLNRNGYTTRDGYRTIVISIYMTGTRERVVVNTRIKVRPSDFRYGKVQPTDPNHDILNRKVKRRIRKLMEYEDELESSGIQPTPRRVKEAYRSHVSKSATIGEMVEAVIIPSSSRSESTKGAYRSLAKSFDEFRPNTTMQELSHDMIERYRSFLTADKGLAENTAIGRLKALHALCEEARKRDAMPGDPFRFITIGNMKPKVAFLSLSEIARIERLRLEGRYGKVRDLFLLGCYSGLRWSDLSTLEEAVIKGGVLRKTMYKTKRQVSVPIKSIFWGKGLDIINRYPDIRQLSHCVSCNSTANRIIKEIAEMAGIRKNVSFHIARKSCATNLSLMNMNLQYITTILGQSRTRTTEAHYTFDKEHAAEKATKKLFRKRKPRQ